MTDNTTSLTIKLATALREIHQQIEHGDVRGVSRSGHALMEDALRDFDRAQAAPSPASKPLPGYHHFEVRLPGFDPVEAAHLLVVVEAPNLATVRQFVPAHSDVVQAARLVEVDDLHYVLPIKGPELRDWAWRAVAEAAPADALSRVVARLLPALQAAGVSANVLTEADRQENRKLVEEGAAQLQKHLVQRAGLKAFHEALLARTDNIATHDDYAELVDELGVMIDKPLS